MMLVGSQEVVWAGSFEFQSMLERVVLSNVPHQVSKKQSPNGICNTEQVSAYSYNEAHERIIE